MRTVGVRLTADIADFQRKFRQAGSDAKSLGGQLDKANKAGKLDHATMAAAGLGVGLLGAAGAAIKMNMDFEKSMSGVRAATHAGAGDMEKLRQAAIKAGADTQYSATGAADAITELSKAGIGTADILNGGLSGALSLAAAGELDVGEAAETAASALTQFKLKGADVPHVADLLSAAAGKAQGSVHDMGAALNQVGLIASGTGLSIEDTTGTLAAFASAGLVGSDAGTSFKTMLQSVQAPSGHTKDLMDELGISLYDTGGRFIGITAFAQQLKEKLGTLTPELRANAMAQIFGSDATRAAKVLYEQGADGIQKWIDKTNDAGYAAETAALKTDNLAGDMERLKGSLDTLLIQGGGGAQGGLRVIAQFLEGLVNNFGRLPSVVSGSIVVLGGLTGAALLTGVGVLKVRKAVAEMNAQLIASGPAGEKAASGLSKVTGAVGKAAGILAVWQAAMAAADTFSDKIPANTEAMAAGLNKFGQGADLAGNSAQVLGKNLDNLTGGFKFLADADNNRRKTAMFLEKGLESTIPGLSSYSQSLANTQAQIDAVDAALSSMVASGNISGADAAFQRLTGALAVDGVTVEEVKKKFPGYAAALEAAGSSANGMAGATGDAAGATDDLGQAAAEARKQADALQAAFDKLFKQYLSTDEAAIKLKDTQVATDKELKEGTHTLSLNSDEGRKNRQAMIDRLDAINTMRDAEISNGTAVAKADAKYKGQIDTLRKTMLHLGYTKDDVDALLGKYKKIPDDVGTTIKTPGMGTAKANADDLWNKLKKVDGTWNLNFQATGYNKTVDQLLTLLAAQQALKDGKGVSEARRELSHFFAGGGPVYGPGTATSDSIVARLSAGEHVWTAAEVAAVGGQEAMLRMRAAAKAGLFSATGDDTPGFARGGYINLPFPTTTRDTKIPHLDFGGPPGGMTYRWIESVVRAAFPGMAVLSDYRPGARTLSGNRSYHAIGRAVDFPPSRPLAEWFNLHYMPRIKELITPWNSLNIHNGKRHTYTGAIYRQHNFSGGNAHDHVAMRSGGTITEPIYGVGASGRTYSFGENYMPERVTPNYMPDSGGRGSGTSVVVHVQAGYVVSEQQLQDKLVSTFDTLKRLGRV